MRGRSECHHGRVATPYWLRGDAPAMDLPPIEDGVCDVLIVGGGFTGLWTALALTDTDPGLRVVVLEAETVAFGATGRNGGFCEASLTHGLANGIRHFPDELERLEAEGLANLRELIAFTRDHAIECDLEETGTLTVADQPFQADEFRAWLDEAAEHGEHLEFMDRTTVQAEVHSPLWQAGLYRPPGRDALLDPAALCRGLARVARARGIRIHEHTRVTGLTRVAGGVRVATAAGVQFRAAHVVVATSAYSGWLRRLRAVFVPVYDYVIVSEPLTPEERRSIGWRRRQGLSDANNQFHYFRLTADDRILWGGYDAIHYFGSRVAPELDDRPATFRRLEAQFVRAFPQLGTLALPVPLGRGDRHDDAVHGDLRPGDGWPADLCARLHGSGRRRESLGGRCRPRPDPAPGRGPAPLADRAESAGPLPARAAALDGGQRRPARARPGGPQRRPPLTAYSGRSTGWGSALNS